MSNDPPPLCPTTTPVRGNLFGGFGQIFVLAQSAGSKMPFLVLSGQNFVTIAQFFFRRKVREGKNWGWAQGAAEFFLIPCPVPPPGRRTPFFQPYVQRPPPPLVGGQKLLVVGHRGVYKAHHTCVFYGVITDFPILAIVMPLDALLNPPGRCSPPCGGQIAPQQLPGGVSLDRMMLSKIVHFRHDISFFLCVSLLLLLFLESVSAPLLGHSVRLFLQARDGSAVDDSPEARAKRKAEKRSKSQAWGPRVPLPGQNSWRFEMGRMTKGQWNEPCLARTTPGRVFPPSLLEKGWVIRFALILLQTSV